MTDNVSPVEGTVADGGSTNDTTPTLSGTAEAGSTVTIYQNETEVGTTTANVDSQWTFTPSLTEDGSYFFTATATDAAGNVSDASSTYTITLDTAAPAAPTIQSAEDDVPPVEGTVASGGSTNDTTPTLSGTAEAGSTVTIYQNETEVGTTTANVDSQWTFTPSLTEDGSYFFTATATDAAGNVSDASSTYTITLDTAAPAAPTIQSAEDDVPPVEGTVASGGSTNDTTPTLSGTAEAGSTVTIYQNETEVGTTTANVDSQWTFTPSLTEDGSYFFTVMATDAAGNVSDASSTYTVTLDTAAPAAPVIELVTDDFGNELLRSRFSRQTLMASLPSEINPQADPLLTGGTAFLTPVQGYNELGEPGYEFDGNFLRSPTNNAVTLTLNNLPHTSINVDVLFAAIDSLDGTGTFPAGDFLNVKVDGVSIFRRSLCERDAGQI